MTGYSEAELRQLSPIDITHGDDQAVTDAIIAANAAGDAQRIEKRYRRKDGGVIWVEVSAFLAPAPEARLSSPQSRLTSPNANSARRR